MLVRGRNYCSEQQLVDDTNRKIVALAAQRGVPISQLTVMGGGIAEWRRDRDRHLYLHSGFVSSGSAAMLALGTGNATSVDLLNLTSVLARQHFGAATLKVSVG